MTDAVHYTPIYVPPVADGIPTFDPFAGLSDCLWILVAAFAIGFYRTWDETHSYAHSRAMGYAADNDFGFQPLNLDGWTIWTPTLLLARVASGISEISAGIIAAPMLSRFAYWLGGLMAHEVHYWICLWQHRRGALG